jgi:serine/threonine protein kinase
MGYTHNDLKPDNILYKLEGDKYTFKIGDFGLSQYLGIPFPNLSKIFMGSTHIKAPNSADNSYYLDGNKYNYNSDMFSLGATMFWICMRVHGVRWTDFRVSETEVFVDIRKKNFLDQVVKVKGMYGEDGYNFLIKCMEPKSSNRMSSKKALEHPYLRPLRGGAFEDILTKITKMYREPTMDEIIRGKYELEFLEDMYNCYKDRRVNLYVDFTKKSVDVVPRHMPTLFNWLYDSSNSFKFPTLETFFQAQLSFINILNNKKLSKTDLQLWGIGTLNICHKLLSDLVVFSIDIDDLVWVSLKQFTPKQLIGVQKDILRTLGGNIQVTPVTFFLNYWYLKSIYTGTRKVPNVNVLSTSISAMLALMVSNTKPELQNVKLDDLAKYCVKKALVLEGYTHGANVDILTIPSGLESLLNTCITESCSIDIEYQELYRSIKNTLKCK